MRATLHRKKSNAMPPVYTNHPRVRERFNDTGV